MSLSHSCSDFDICVTDLWLVLIKGLTVDNRMQQKNLASVTTPGPLKTRTSHDPLNSEHFGFIADAPTHQERNTVNQSLWEATFGPP